MLMIIKVIQEGSFIYILYRNSIVYFTTFNSERIEENA